MAVRLTLDRTAVRRVPIRLIRPTVEMVTRAVERDARRTVQKASGTTRNLIRRSVRESTRGVRGVVDSPGRLSRLLHDGSPPHPIPLDLYPGRKLLRFYWDKVGAIVYFHQVSHPGFEGSRFLTTPLIRHGTRAGMVVTTIAPGRRTMT